ncbi:MAG: M48 family metalloprotease [Phycisphaerales bacterium]
MRTMAIVLGIVLAVGSLAGCSTNLATGESQFDILSRDEEIALGISGKAEMLTQMGGEVKNPDLRAYVDSVGKSLAAVTEGDNPSLPWEFTLIDSDVINAFALPGGKVFVSRGLAEKMTNEAQLAAVLGHEVGHVTARHINDRYTRIMGAQLVLGAAGSAVGDESGEIQKMGAQVVQVGLMTFDRDQESQSDSLGMRYMVRLNYDPQGMKQVMDILKAASAGQAQPEWMSTHPLPQTRIQRVTDEIAAGYANTQNNAAFKLKETEFKQQFLKKLTAEPRPARRGVYAFSGHNPTDDALMWCSVCRDRAPAAKP